MDEGDDRMARAPARQPRVGTLAYLRTEVLGVTQEQMARILGRGSVKTIWNMEHDEVDMLTMDQLRRLYLYALEERIRWPAALTHRLLLRELDTLDEVDSYGRRTKR